MLNSVRLTVAGIANKLKAKPAKEAEFRDGKYFDAAGKQLKKGDVEKGSGVKYSKQASRFTDVKTGKYISASAAFGRMNLAKPAAALPTFSSKVLKAEPKKEDLVGKITESVDNAIQEESLIESLEKNTKAIEKILSSVGEKKQPLDLHDKLNLVIVRLQQMMAANALDDATDIIDGPDKNKKKNRKPKGRGRFGRFLRGARAAATGVTGTAVIAGAAAVAVTGTGLYALNRGMTKTGEEAKGGMDALESKYGLKTLYDKGVATGYEVDGKKYTIDNLPQEYKDLINAYGPGDKRSFAAREAIKRIKENPQKYKALEITSKLTSGTTSPTTSGASVAPAAPVSATPTPTTPSATPSASVAAGAPANAPATSPTPSASRQATSMPASSGPSRRLGPAAAKRGKVDPAAAKNAALAAAAKQGITGPHLAQFMAQLDHESGGFKSVEENLRYSAKRLMEIFPKYYKDPAVAEAEEYQPQAIANRVYGGRMGNGPPESGDGYKYRGRGLIQLTGKDNYKRFGQLAGIDLVGNPDMAGDLGTAADIAAAFYKKNVMDKGVDGNDTTKVTKIINGGSHGLSHRAQLFASYSNDPSTLKATGPAPEPMMVVSTTETPPAAATTDVKIGGGVSGGGTEEAKPTQVAAADKPAAAPGITPVAQAQTPQLAATTPAPSAPTAVPVQPTPTSGERIAAETTAVTSARETMVASASKPVVISPPQQKGQQQAVPPMPSTSPPKASVRHAESSFVRALAKDFAHPSAFTTIGTV